MRHHIRLCILILLLLGFIGCSHWVDLSQVGIYPPESRPDGLLTFRWTSGNSALAFPNPGGHAILALRMFANPSGLTPLNVTTDSARAHIIVQPGLRRYSMLLPVSAHATLDLQLQSPIVDVNGRALGVALVSWSLVGDGRLPLHMLLGLVVLCAALILIILRRVDLPPRWRSVALLTAVTLPALALLEWQWWLLFRLPVLHLILFSLASALILVAVDRHEEQAGWALWGWTALAMMLVMGLAWLLLPGIYSPIMLPGSALAAGGLFLLLRQAAWSRSDATIATGVSLFGALLWYQNGLWRPESTGPVMVLVGLGALAAVALERWLGLANVNEQPAEKARLDWRPLLLLLGLALLIRIPLLITPDPVGDLDLSARRMAELHQFGLAGAFTDEGDYMPLRLSILTLLARIVQALGGTFLAPLPPLTLVAIKLPSLIAECLTVVLLYSWVQPQLGRRKAVLLAALYTLSPPIWINSAWWGQVDTLLMLPLLASVLLLTRRRVAPAWAAWTLALLIKTQAIIILPVLVIVTLRRFGCRGLVRGGTAAAGTWLLGIFPFIIVGQISGMLDAYAGAVGRFTRATTGAYNLWYLVVGPEAHDTLRLFDSVSLRMLGIALLGAAIGLIGFVLLRRPDADTLVRAATVSAFAFFMLPTQIHERYLFLALAFAAASIAFSERRAIPYILLMLSATLNVLGELSGFVPIIDAFASHSLLPQVLAACNLVLLGWMLYDLVRLHPVPCHERMSP